MRIRVLYICLLIMISGCSYRVVRTGYEKSTSKHTTCDIAVKKNMAIPNYLIKIGEVKLGETGFSFSCSEAHAIEFLKKEGCALRADVINITKENIPDLWSSCYRCSAEFYIFTSPQTRSEHKESYMGNVYKPVRKSQSKNTAIVIGAVVIGFLVGFLIFQP